MKSKLIYYLIILGLSVNSYVSAQNYAAALKISTLGMSVEGIRSLGDHFNTRVGLSFFNFKFNGTGDNEEWKYSAKVKLLSVSALADWHPFRGSFRFTGGALFNLNKSEATLYPIKTYKIGGTLYTPLLLGNASATVTLNKVAPYLGIGFGRPTSGNCFAFSMDLGVIYQGSPKVDLTAQGLLEPSAEQGPLIEDNIKWFKFYPVISVGSTYTF
jgi:hypothetical protein